MGKILFAGEKPYERAALLCDVIADRAAQHRIARLEGIEQGPLRNRALNLELHLAINPREFPQMERKLDSDQDVFSVIFGGVSTYPLLPASGERIEVRGQLSHKPGVIS